MLLQMALFHSLLWLSIIPNIPLCVCRSVCVCLSLTQQLICQWTFSYFHVLAIENTAVMNIGVHVSFQIIIFQKMYVQELDCW